MSTTSLGLRAQNSASLPLLAGTHELNLETDANGLGRALMDKAGSTDGGINKDFLLHGRKKTKVSRKRGLSGNSSGASLCSEKDGIRWASSENAKNTLLSVLSGLYAMLLVILSLAFEISIIVVDSANNSKYSVFYIYLYGLSLTFFFYCYAFLFKPTTWKETLVGWTRMVNWRKESRRKSTESYESYSNARDNRASFSIVRKASHSAPSAGSMYLKMGCIVFGVVGLIAKGLQLFSIFDRGLVFQCRVWTSIAEIVLVMVFLFVQMCFVFENSKLVIHRSKSVARLGLMHLIATNLCTWIRSIVQEQNEAIMEIREGLHHLKSRASTEQHLLDAIYNVADALFSSDSSFDHAPKSPRLDTEPRTFSHAGQIGAIDSPSGVVSRTNSTTTLPPCYAAAFQRSAIGALITEVRPFMITCIIEYSLICSAVMYILWRNVGRDFHERKKSRKQRFHVDCSSSTRGLFLGLLFMVFTIISMIIFFTKTRSDQNYQALWVFYASDSILYIVSLIALIMGMLKFRKLYYVPDQKNTLLLDDILLIVGLVGQLTFCVFSMVPLNRGSLTASMIIVTSLIRMVEVLVQTIVIFFGQRMAKISSRRPTKNPGREMVTFLLLTNLSMFLINTFETQKAGSMPLMSEFYGESIWTVIVYSTVPLCIFYRFHSSVCLAEIWKHAYRVKTPIEFV